MLSKEWLSAFLPIGVSQPGGQWLPLGAGCLVHVGPLVWFVTANHVVLSAQHHSLSLLVPRADGQGILVVELTPILKESGIDWIRAEASDLAAAPFPISPEFSIKAVGRENCISLNDVLPSMPAYTVGCPYGVRGFDPDSALPLVLSGIISGVAPREKLLYTSAPTFKGNSGGPLVVERPPYDPSGNLTVGPATVFLAGIVLQMALVEAESGGNQGLPPLHLGIAVSTDAVLALLDGKEASQVVRKLGLE